MKVYVVTEHDLVKDCFSIYGVFEDSADAEICAMVKNREYGHRSRYEWGCYNVREKA